MHAACALIIVHVHQFTNSDAGILGSIRMLAHKPKTCQLAHHSLKDELSRYNEDLRNTCVSVSEAKQSEEARLARVQELVKVLGVGAQHALRGDYDPDGGNFEYEL